jgi:NAD(P)-dependent dehydrogenase (short-subunit alcohol dehydrogenase family)
MKKFVFISGATDGIGKQTALELAIKGYNLYLHGRNPERIKETKAWIRKQVPGANIKSFLADFSSLAEVKQMAESFLDQDLPLDILINNAGVFEKKLSFSKDHYERTFAVNHLAPFLLSNLLLNKLKTRTDSRIINVASMAQASSIDFETLNAEKGYNPYEAYELSKLCNVLFSFKLAKILKNHTLAVNALHPGVISTKVLHAGWGMGGGSWHEGATTSVFLATSAEGGKNSGFYYSNMRKAKASPAAYIPENQDLLWQKSMEMCSDFIP